MPPKRRVPPNGDQDMINSGGDVVALKRAQVAAWRQASDPIPCAHEEPLMLAWYKGTEPIGEPSPLSDGDITKRGDTYKGNGVVGGYVIFCPTCDQWQAIGEKHDGDEG